MGKRTNTLLLSLCGLFLFLMHSHAIAQSFDGALESELNIRKMTGRFYGTEGNWTYRFDTSFAKSFSGNSLDFKVTVACKIDGASSLGPVDSEGFHQFVIRSPYFGQIEQALQSRKTIPFVIQGFSQTSVIVDKTSDLSEFSTMKVRKGFFNSGKITATLTEHWQYAGNTGKNAITLTVDKDGSMTIKGLQNKDRSKTVGTVRLIPQDQYKFSRIYQTQ